MKFSLEISAKDRATSRFMLRALTALAHAAVDRLQSLGMTQQDLADQLGLDKSRISRLLHGAGNPTLRTIGELAWALGLRPQLTFVPLDAAAAEPKIANATSSRNAASSTSTSAVVRSGSGNVTVLKRAA